MVKRRRQSRAATGPEMPAPGRFLGNSDEGAVAEIFCIEQLCGCGSRLRWCELLDFGIDMAVQIKIRGQRRCPVEKKTGNPSRATGVPTEAGLEGGVFENLRNSRRRGCG